ncbi:MAG TPA: type II toxin-antitoxin system Phd/YefM family antitoxin [Rhizomicrobium sp.]|jgi:prevent-host-death family protein|nr:type II toxin-antitoxin system Phd/YefM family antitoxin [Rhizomicrobium sp.]
MKTMNLRDANQQFSKLAREIEETGETILVLRNGKPAVKIMPVEERPNKLTREQEEAKKRLMDPAFNLTLPYDWKFDREEIYEEAVLRHGVVRKATFLKQKKRRRG